MKSFKTLVLLGASLCAASAEAVSNFDYDYAEIGVFATSADILNVEVDGNGTDISGSLGLTEGVNLLASYQTTDFDFGLEGTQFGAGLGYHGALSYGIDLYLRLLYLDAEIEFPRRIDIEEIAGTGYSLNVGVRYRFNKKFEADVAIAQASVDDSTSTGIIMAGRFRMSEIFSLGLSGAFADSTESLGLDIRAEFD
jgi:hypothetical protein